MREVEGVAEQLLPPISVHNTVATVARKKLIVDTVYVCLLHRSPKSTGYDQTVSDPRAASAARRSDN